VSPRALSTLLLVAALVVIAGGVVGFVRAGSVASLGFAGIVGLFWIGAAVGIRTGAPTAPVLASVMAVVLAAAMAQRWIAKGATMPALPVIVVCLVVLVAVVTRRRTPA
jgi:uncharacterized membrane protein (UPF0136 family)